MKKIIVTICLLILLVVIAVICFLSFSLQPCEYGEGEELVISGVIIGNDSSSCCPGNMGGRGTMWVEVKTEQGCQLNILEYYGASYGVPTSQEREDSSVSLNCLSNYSDEITVSGTYKRVGVRDFNSETVETLGKTKTNHNIYYKYFDFIPSNCGVLLDTARSAFDFEEQKLGKHRKSVWGDELGEGWFLTGYCSEYGYKYKLSSKICYSPTYYDQKRMKRNARYISNPIINFIYAYYLQILEKDG